MSDNQDEFILALAFCCCVVYLISNQWDVIKCLLCKLCGANTSNSSSLPVNVERQFQDDTIPQNYSTQFQGSELELSIINALPMYQIKKNEAQEMPINVDCAICLGEFEEGEWLKRLPNCNHGFHVSCIGTWFQFHSSCPLCRSRVYRVLVSNNECFVPSHTRLEILGMNDITPERNVHFQSHSL